MEIELKCKFDDAKISATTQKVSLSFEIDQIELQALEDLKSCTKDLKLKITEWRKQRSTNANAYFHLLVNKIAQTLNTSMQEIKQRLVFDYGTIETNENGIKLGFEARADIPISTLFEYAKEIGEVKKGEKSFKRYIIFKRTHTLDTAEMSKLIDGTVQEAKELGIQTMTPNELAKLKSLWEAQK